MSVVIVDYGSGNLHSAAKAFERAARETDAGGPIVVTGDPAAVRRADRIVLPGVGAFRDCRDGLAAVPGMWETIDEEVRQRGKPFFGICVGMQLMASRGLELETTEGFGWIAGDVVRITPSDPSLKIPHMGWNEIETWWPTHLLDGLDGEHFYFVHSYHLNTPDVEDVAATVDYGGRVTAVVQRDNMLGVQFHPEKSQKAGLKLIANFLTWSP